MREDRTLSDVRRLWHQMIGHWRTNKLEERFAPIHDLSPAETRVLDLVAECPDVILREISDSLGLRKSTFTSLLDRLERRGLIQRTISPRDRRSYGLVLTDRGRIAYEAHVLLESEMWRKAFACLDGDEERDRFVASLRKIAKGLDQ